MWLKNNFHFIALLTIIVLISTLVMQYGTNLIAEISEYDATMSMHVELPQLEKSAPIIAKGLYLTATSAASTKKRQEIIKLISETELNTVVIDIKDYSGHILYESRVPLVDQLHTSRVAMRNVKAIIKEFKEAGIYVIARQVVFQDPALAQAKPEWAIHRADGSLWRDYKGLSWVDPTQEEVWKYNMDIAQEAAKLGFNEINFDYVRFPSDGNISTAMYTGLQESKAETMRQFYEFVHERLKDLPVYTSLDLFGLVLEAHNFDLNIGQELSKAIGTVDYIYPMTYPSHYAAGHLGYANPADYPYAIIRNGLAIASKTMSLTTTRLRPWLQAFDLGAVYDGQKIRAEIAATEESTSTAGWMLWNASNRYSAQGLMAKDN